MKIEETYNELVGLAKSFGITVRREQGSFKGSHCLLNEEKIILLNKNSSYETASSIIARALSQIINIEEIFLSPVLRNYITKEMQRHKK